MYQIWYTHCFIPPPMEYCDLFSILYERNIIHEQVRKKGMNESFPS